MGYKLATISAITAVTTDSEKPGIRFTTTLLNGSTSADHQVSSDNAVRFLGLAKTFDIAAIKGRECVVEVDRGFMSFWAFADMVDTTDMREAA